MFRLLSDLDDENPGAKLASFDALEGFFDQPTLSQEADPAGARFSFWISGLRPDGVGSALAGWPQS